MLFDLGSFEKVLEEFTISRVISQDTFLEILIGYHFGRYDYHGKYLRFIMGSSYSCNILTYYAQSYLWGFRINLKKKRIV